MPDSSFTQQTYPFYFSTFNFLSFNKHILLSHESWLNKNIFPAPFGDVGFWLMLRRVNPQVFVLLGVCPQLVLCISWVLWNPTKSMKNILANPGTVILECRDSSPVWPISAFSYLGLLILTCLCFSVKISKLSPAFSEIRFITFSMLVCSLICLAFVPAYASTEGKYSTASEIFALLATAFGIMSCICVPKCSILKRKCVILLK